MQVGYDDSLVQRFGGLTKTKIILALTHTMATFQLPSLGTKITIKVDSWHKINKKLSAGSAQKKDMEETTENTLKGKMPYTTGSSGSN